MENRTAHKVRHLLYEVLDLLAEDSVTYFLESAKRLEEAADILRNRAAERRSSSKAAERRRSKSEDLY